MVHTFKKELKLKYLVKQCYETEYRLTPERKEYQQVCFALSLFCTPTLLFKKMDTCRQWLYL